MSLYSKLNQHGSVYSGLLSAVTDAVTTSQQINYGFESFSDLNANKTTAGVVSLEGAIGSMQALVASQPFMDYASSVLSLENHVIPQSIQNNMALLGAVSRASVEGYDLKTILNQMYPAMESFAEVKNGMLISDNNYALAGNSLTNSLAAEIISKEAFANGTTATVNKELNVAFNMASAIQDPFIEAFFPTVIRTPDQTSFLFRITIDSFYNGYQHDPKKTPEDNFGRVNLIEATRRPSVILREELRLVPHYRDSGNDNNTALFMDKAIVDTEIVEVNGIAVPTAPFKLGEDVDTQISLFSHARHPQLIDGTFDETDMVDPAAKLKTLYVQLKEGNDHVVRFNVEHLDTSAFVPVQMGNINEIQVTFRSSDFAITGGMLNTKGVKPAGIDELLGDTNGGYHVRCEVTFNALLNVETGVLNINGYNVRPKSATKWVKEVDGMLPDPTKIPLDNEQLKTELTKLKLKVVGYELLLFRTNQNLRTTGLILDYDQYFARYNVTPKSPIRVQHPLTNDKSNQYPHLEKLVTATRTAKRADGYKTLFSFESGLKSIVTDYKRNGTYMHASSIVGMSARFLAPVFIEEEFNPKRDLIYTETKNLIVNIRHAIENQLHYMITKLVNESNYVAASAVLNGGIPRKPKVIIGTSTELAMFLSAGGDISSLTDKFEYVIVESNVLEMRNRIYVAIVGETAADSDGMGVLNFGHTFVYPDTVVTISPHHQNGRYAETTMLVPRYEHVPNACVMGRMNVVGLDELMKAYKAFPTRTITE